MDSFGRVGWDPVGMQDVEIDSDWNVNRNGGERIDLHRRWYVNIDVDILNRIQHKSRNRG